MKISEMLKQVDEDIYECFGKPVRRSNIMFCLNVQGWDDIKVMPSYELYSDMLNYNHLNVDYWEYTVGGSSENPYITVDVILTEIQ